MIQNNPRRLVASIVSIFALILIVISMPKALAQTTSERASGQVESTFPEPREVNSSVWSPHIGVRAGYVNADENFNGSAEFGAEAGYQPYIPMGIGLELTRSVSGHDSDSHPDLERTNLLARATYNFGGTIPVVRTSYVGLGTGPVFDHDNNSDQFRWGYNMLAGFDIPLSYSMGLGPKSFSVGAIANYLIVSDNGPDAFSLNGALKYWF